MRRSRPSAGAQLVRRTRARKDEARATRELSQAVALRLEEGGVHACDHDEPRCHGVHRLADRVEWRVGAEEQDAPSVRAEHETKGDQTEVVTLAGRAGEKSEGPAAATPVASECEQPLPDDVRCEMLLPDLDLATFPFVADLAQSGKDELL